MRKILPNKVIVVYQPKVVLGLKKKKKKKFKMFERTKGQYEENLLAKVDIFCNVHHKKF